MVIARNSLVAFLAVLAISLVGQARADLTGTEAAVSFPTNARTGVGAGTQTRGFTFTLDSARTITHLGMSNYNGTGVANNDRHIGLWNDAGILVADVTIPGGPNPAGVELDPPTSDGTNFLFMEIASPIVLQAGELYTAGIHYLDNSPGLAYNRDVVTIDGFNYMGTAETGPPGGVFEKPTIIRADRLNGYFGPNLRFQTSTCSLSDLTGNCFVDFEDLTILLANWNKEVGSELGNLVNADTTPVNFEDLTVLLADWTGPGPAGSPEAALGAEAIPEPSTLLLALLATLGLSVCWRRRTQKRGHSTFPSDRRNVATFCPQ